MSLYVNFCVCGSIRWHVRALLAHLALRQGVPHPEPAGGRRARVEVQASQQAVGDASESPVDEGPAGDQQDCQDLPLLPHHPRHGARHQRLHANPSDIRCYYIFIFVCVCVCSCRIIRWLFAASGSSFVGWSDDMHDDDTLFCMFTACSSVLAAVNGLKLRAPHLTTGTVMLKATYVRTYNCTVRIYLLAYTYGLYIVMLLYIQYLEKDVKENQEPRLCVIITTHINNIYNSHRPSRSKYIYLLYFVSSTICDMQLVTS
jgi:hypothetical protein